MIELTQVSLHRGEAVILEKAFLRIEEAQIVLVSGPSGIGKTSLLSLLGGFVSADSGEVLVFGHDVARMRASSTSLLRRKLAFVPQELELINDLSAMANVRLALEVCGFSRRETKARAAEALTALDLADALERRVSELSTGQRRRVSLARGMVRESEIFVADEPSNDLDAGRVLQLVALLEAKREAGGALILATNDPRLLVHAQQPGWRHLTLAGGQLVPGDVSALHSSMGLSDTSQKEEGGTLVPFPVNAARGLE